MMHVVQSTQLNYATGDGIETYATHTNTLQKLLKIGNKTQNKAENGPKRVGLILRSSDRPQTKKKTAGMFSLVVESDVWMPDLLSLDVGGVQSLKVIGIPRHPVIFPYLYKYNYVHVNENYIQL